MLSGGRTRGDDFPSLQRLLDDARDELVLDSVLVPTLYNLRQPVSAAAVEFYAHWDLGLCET